MITDLDGKPFDMRLDLSERSAFIAASCPEVLAYILGPSVEPGKSPVYALTLNPTSPGVEELARRVVKAMEGETLLFDSAAASVLGTEGAPLSEIKADIVITITRATSPVIRREWVRPGTHFSCIGADMPGKEEIDPAILTEGGISIIDLLVAAKLAASKGEARRLIQQGGITLNGEKGEDFGVMVSRDELKDSVMLRKGKKVYKKAILARC